MELVEIAGLLELIKHTNRIHYPWRDRGTVFRELYIIKPLEKLVKLGDNRSELVGRSCIEGLQSARSTNSLLNAGPPKFCDFPFRFLSDCCGK